MKKLLILLLSLFAGIELQAQIYQNKWIDLSKTYDKFQLEKDGLYRIGYETLLQAGLPLEGSGYKLYNKGKEVPIYVSTNGTFGAGDYIEFVGKANDGELDAFLFQNPTWQISKDRSLYTKKATYFLASDNSSNNLRYQTISNNLANAPAAEPFFLYTSKKILNTAHSAGEPFSNLSGVNNNYADFGKGEGWVGPIIVEGTEQSTDVVTPYIYQNGGTAFVESKITGRSNEIQVLPDHHIQLKINDQIVVDETYEGYSLESYSFNVDLNVLADNNEVGLASIGDIAGVSIDRNSLCYVFITYPRLFNFENQRSFFFSIDNIQNRYLEINNFNGGTAPVLYDLTNNVRLVPTLDGTTYKIFLPGNGGTLSKRDLYISNTTETTTDAVNIVSNLVPQQFTNFADPSKAADYIIITHSKLRGGEEDQVQRYQTYRSSAQGGGYQVLVADIDELYDQFAWGVLQHPLSIMNFVNYIIDNYEAGIWATQPEYLLLMGRSIRYSKTNLPDLFARNLVPTFGETGSDMMLTVPTVYAYKNQLAVGRISAETPEHIKRYLDKVIEYEANMNIQNTPCTKTDRLWMKDIVHVAGGKNASEATNYTNNLNGYKQVIEDTLWGAKVQATFSKAEGGIIAAPQQFKNLMNNGLSMVTYIGHSGGALWEFDIQSPDDYDNAGKYPFFYSNSCFVGDVHSPDNDIMALVYSLAEQRGAIAFLATVGFGFPYYLDIYGEEMYRQMAYENYGGTLGQFMQKTIENIYIPSVGASHYYGIRLTCQEFTLAGDPAIRLNQWQKPEYVTEENDLYFNPSVLTTAIDSFDVNVVVTNLGKAVADSFSVQVIHTLPDGTQNIVKKRFKGVYYRDTLSLRLPIGEAALGSNGFSLSIDSDNELPEDCEDNNILNTNIFILPGSALPIHPCEFSIVGTTPVKLQASTALPVLTQPRTYRLEIDTVPEFNTTFLQYTTLSSSGGIIEWQPALSYEAQKVYYWRISIVPETGGNYNWQSSSFIYIPNQPDGWNQSHYGQYTRNSYNGTFLNAQHQFEFDDEFNNLRGFVNNTETPQIYSLYLNDVLISAGSCLIGSNTNCLGGIAFAVFKPEKILSVVESELDPSTQGMSGCNRKGMFGNVQCGGGNIYEFYTGDEDVYTQIKNFLDWVPQGYYVVAYSVGNHRLESSAASAAALQPLYTRFSDLGFPQLASIESEIPFFALLRKGVVNYTPKILIGGVSDEVLEYNENVFGKTDEGTYTSTLIGPSALWQSLQWQATPLEAGVVGELFNVDVIGVRADGVENTLFNTNTINNWDLSFVDASVYPFLRLRANNKDVSYLTPSQLEHWRVYHKKYPELAFNSSAHFSVTDTLYITQTGKLEIAVTNASPVASDSVYVQVSTTNANNVTQQHAYAPQAPFAGGETRVLNIDFPAGEVLGASTLTVQLNPNKIKPDKFDFNNQLQIPFWVLGDNINPVADVTFDGQHILDGDIVSTQPEVQITLYDENTVLPLNDTAAFDIVLIYPDGTLHPVSFADPSVIFTPANAGNDTNEAMVTFSPQLAQDGTYQLQITATDRSGNTAGNGTTYSISFEVITQSSISHLLNYPNPFTTSTRFAFVLTGGELPTQFKIQVMTIAGTVVREIGRSEIGDLRIGRNLTEYAWDGKDTYGNELANGVYFYRVIAKKANGEDFELFSYKKESTTPKYNISSTTTMDGMFNKYGLGKMYKMR
ncbi:MAG: hypothetical protein IPL35_07280 [Sphingobacteriales bacterium]|nr:hypothetical protein [Sphingobacteriales bacterium]